MKRTKRPGAHGAKRQFHLLAVFFENILIRVDTVNIWLCFGIGGLTMAKKLICDRCGAEINPKSSVTYVGIRLLKMEIYDNDYELCVSCVHELRAWLSGKENDDD